MHSLVLLAKLAVEAYVKEEKIIDIPDDFPEEFLKRKAGVFVTIEKENNLRGCIGTYLPTKENIAKETISNSIAAAFKDYRFESVSKEDLPFLSYAVYVLNPPELVKDISELNPQKYGIIIQTSQDSRFKKCGLLLPDLEGVDTPEEQISIACNKGGVDPEREKIMIYKFTVEKYEA